MKRFGYHIISIFCCLAIFASAASAAVPSVTARLDSVQLMMGNITMLRLEVVKDASAEGEFPMFAAPSQSGYVGICGDSIELRTSIKRDTAEIGSGRIQINYQVPLQAFDSGSFQLPAFVYVSGRDTARSNLLNLKVLPVPGLTADSEIAPLAPVAEPEGKSFFDFLPDFIVDFWWLVILILLAVAAAVWAVRRYRKEGAILPKKPEPNPYDVAMDALVKLKEKNLWAQGMEKEYFTELTEILRVYLEKRFGVNAMEMTSRQIMETLQGLGDVREKRDYIRQILSVADFVKFAKVRPLPADNIAAYDNAVRFVEETKPVPVVAEASKEAGDAKTQAAPAADNRKGGGK